MSHSTTSGGSRQLPLAPFEIDEMAAGPQRALERAPHVDGWPCAARAESAGS